MSSKKKQKTIFDYSTDKKPKRTTAKYWKLIQQVRENNIVILNERKNKGL